MKRVLCDATADAALGGGFMVTVQGRGEHEGTFRVYTINKKIEGNAAMEGIERFVQEMQDEK